MATQRKKKNSTNEQIVSWYTDFCLTNGRKPNSVYEFSKLNGIEEADFYKHFSSFEQLESGYFSKMFQYTLELLADNTAYSDYDAAQKLTSFYFTFFEMATANRSFVKYLLEDGALPLKNLVKLKTLRLDFLQYVKTVLEAPLQTDNKKLTGFQHRLVSEGAWIQFLSILGFWLKDTSPNFEKTDIFIEKSVKAAFDVVYNVPVESIIDFGKFIWKEKMADTFTSK